MPNKNRNRDTIESPPAWLQSYVDSPTKQQQLYKRTLIIIVLSQIFGGAGLAAGITVGALLAQDMLGSEGLTGAPTALFTLGSAIAALLVGRLSEIWSPNRISRRIFGWRHRGNRCCNCCSYRKCNAAFCLIVYLWGRYGYKFAS